MENVSPKSKEYIEVSRQLRTKHSPRLKNTWGACLGTGLLRIISLIQDYADIFPGIKNPDFHGPGLI